MSFDVYLKRPPCPACGRGGDVNEVFNITHNVNQIVELCLVAAGSPVARGSESSYRERSWGRLNGWRVGEALPFIAIARGEAYSKRREAEFLRLEPANGWGKLSHVRECFDRLFLACSECSDPNAIIEASG